MKTKLTKPEKAELLPKLRAVLDTGKAWEDATMHHPAGAIIAAVLELQGIEKAKSEDGERGSDGFDSNGWQWDWWQRFNHNGKTYVLSGSGHYGGHSFGPED